MIIGVGLHARRVYIPYFLKLNKKGIKVNLCIGIDMHTQREDIEQYLRDSHLSLEMLYIDKFDYRKGIPAKQKHTLQELVNKYKIGM